MHLHGNPGSSYNTTQQDQFKIHFCRLTKTQNRQLVFVIKFDN